MSYVELAAFAKEVGLWSGIATLVWKGITFLQAATKTAKAIPAFMQSTTNSLTGLQVHVKQAVGNHLTHMEKDIAEMASDTKQFTATMYDLRNDFKDHARDNTVATTKILERLPEL
jgi:hypothetical protein